MTEQEKIRDNLWRTYPSNNPRPGKGWLWAQPRLHDGQHWVVGNNIDPWQDMDAAPRNGAIVWLDVPGHPDPVKSCFRGVVPSWDGCAWACVDEDGWPDSWDEGVCWGESVQPTRWKAIK